MRALALLAAAPAALLAAPLTWSWATPQTFIHCSNSSGPLSPEAAAAMASSGFAVLEKYQALLQPPVRAGGEIKVIEAARQVRALNPNATLIFYYAVDYARTWYDLGRWFDQHSDLEVHNADKRRANHTDSDGGAPNTWGIFDWAQPAARSAWIDRIASVVSTADANGNNLFDGECSEPRAGERRHCAAAPPPCPTLTHTHLPRAHPRPPPPPGIFIDGYRSASGWASGLIPLATPAEQSAWLAGASLLGPALAQALGNDTIRFINPGQVFAQYPGYSANSIEFFQPDDANIAFLQSLIGQFPTIEVHAYIGSDLGKFNLTLAAYLIGVGQGAYLGTGAQWALCDDWLLPHWEYAEALGAPDGLGVQSGGVWRRSFGGGKTTVTLDTGSGGGGGGGGGNSSSDCRPELEGAWSIAGTSQTFALASENTTHRVYNVSCSTACSTSWHTATAVSPAPFAALSIDFHMQPGFHPVRDEGSFEAGCSLLRWRGGTAWCAAGRNPQCAAAPLRSCVRWASGRATGNDCGA
jgi:hypothetical protein